MIKNVKKYLKCPALARVAYWEITSANFVTFYSFPASSSPPPPPPPRTSFLSWVLWRGRGKEPNLINGYISRKADRGKKFSLASLFCLPVISFQNGCAPSLSLSLFPFYENKRCFAFQAVKKEERQCDESKVKNAITGSFFNPLQRWLEKILCSGVGKFHRLPYVCLSLLSLLGLPAETREEGLSQGCLLLLK